MGCLYIYMLTNHQIPGPSICGPTLTHQCSIVHHRPWTCHINGATYASRILQHGFLNLKKRPMWMLTKDYLIQTTKKRGRWRFMNVKVWIQTRYHYGGTSTLNLHSTMSSRCPQNFWLERAMFYIRMLDLKSILIVRCRYRIRCHSLLRMLPSETNSPSVPLCTPDFASESYSEASVPLCTPDFASESYSEASVPLCTADFASESYSEASVPLCTPDFASESYSEASVPLCTPDFASESYSEASVPLCTPDFASESYSEPGPEAPSHPKDPTPPAGANDVPPSTVEPGLVYWVQDQGAKTGLWIEVPQPKPPKRPRPPTCPPPAHLLLMRDGKRPSPRWKFMMFQLLVKFNNYIDDHFNKKQIMGFWPFLKFKFCHGLSTYVPTVDKYEVRIYQALDVKFWFSDNDCAENICFFIWHSSRKCQNIRLHVLQTQLCCIDIHRAQSL